MVFLATLLESVDIKCLNTKPYVFYFYLYQKDFEWFSNPTAKCACNDFDKGPKKK